MSQDYRKAGWSYLALTIAFSFFTVAFTVFAVLFYRSRVAVATPFLVSIAAVCFFYAVYLASHCGRLFGMDLMMWRYLPVMMARYEEYRALYKLHQATSEELETTKANLSCLHATNIKIGQAYEGLYDDHEELKKLYTEHYLVPDKQN